MSDQTREKATIFVGGLDSQVTAETLHDAFIPFGEIADVTLPKPELKSSQDPHRGFGYIEFALAEDALEAIDNMDQSELYGRVIKVNQAKPQKAAGEKLGSKTAIWEQEDYAAKHNVSEEDRMAVEEDAKAADPMQGLEGLDQAGPKLA
ncbi:hypothetical protein MBLNU13_g01376t1 [Cladosporium sp. NU13]